MYNVTVIGFSLVGKTSLCLQWCGYPFTKSYCATIFIEKHVIDELIVCEVPSHPRFKPNCSTLFSSTDIFVLVVNEDSLENVLYDEIASQFTHASWLLVMNGTGHFPKCRTWGRDREMYMTRVNLPLGEGIRESLMILKELSRRHDSRDPPVSLVGEVYQLIPKCL
jgi:hypothetical protein